MHQSFSELGWIMDCFICSMSVYESQHEVYI